MAKEVKPTVAFAYTIEGLDIRRDRIIRVVREAKPHKPTDKMVVDFGKIGRRVSYGRFTRHPIEDVKDRIVLGGLNFEPQPMGPVVSEALIPGVQYPKAQSGEATIVSPAVNAKGGGRLVLSPSDGRPDVNVKAIGGGSG